MSELLSDGFRIASLLFLVAFGMEFIRSEKKSFRKNILLLFLATVVGYLLAYWEPVQAYRMFFNVTFFLSVSLPFLFWLMSKALFDDDFEWSRKYWILVLSIPILHNVLYHLNETIELGFYRYFRVLPYLVSVVFILLAIYESVKNKEDDLVLSRLKKRNVFVIFSSFLALFSVYFFFVEDPLKLPKTFELIQNIAICIFIFLFMYSQFEYRTLFEGKKESSGINALDANTNINKRIIKKLLTVFENEKLYTSEGITITHLALDLNEKEYLVRRAINGELGYTNFNSFLNHYRISEACRLIAKNNSKELTFQEIAYQLGYQSVATFNRAFKKETGKTPSEFSMTIQ